MELDSTDIQIIEQLEEDGRASMRDIAEELDIAPSTVSKRFKRLKERGVIKGFRPDLDYEKLGYDLTTIIEIKTDSGVFKDSIQEIKQMDSVLSLYQVTGPTDVIIVAKFRSREDMTADVKLIQEISGVIETQTKVALTSPLEDSRLGLKPD